MKNKSIPWEIKLKNKNVQKKFILKIENVEDPFTEELWIYLLNQQTPNLFKKLEINTTVFLMNPTK